MDPTLKGILIGAFMLLVGYGFARLGKSRDRKSDEVLRKEIIAIEAVKERDKIIVKLQSDVKELQMQHESDVKAAIPITAAMQAMLIARLTNDHTPEADALLKKQTDGTLTADDAIKFARLLKERETDNDPRIGRAQQIAAEMLPLTIELKKLDEEAAAKGPCEVNTMMVTVPKTETKAAGDGGTQEEEKGN